MASTKEIKAKELKKAVKELNPFLKKKGYDQIKITGRKPSVILDEFIDRIALIIENDEAAELPDSVIEFYNRNIAGEETVDEKRAKKKGKDTSKTKSKKGSKKTGRRVKGSIKSRETMSDKERLKACNNEEFTTLLLLKGFPEEKIAKMLRKRYKERGVTNEEFIEGRIKIYLNIAKRILKTINLAKELDI